MLVADIEQAFSLRSKESHLWLRLTYQSSEGLLPRTKAVGWKDSAMNQISTNVKSTDKYTNFAIPWLALSQFQALTLYSFLKIHNVFLNNLIILIYNLIFPI